MEELDPYHVFKVPRNFELEAVKAKYKRFCMKLHPDRNVGRDTTRLFQAISYCYQRLLEDYVARLADKPHTELRNASREFAQQQQQRQPPQQQSNSRDKFDLGRFNQLFSSHRLEDPNDVGYEQWMNSTPAEQAAEEERRRQAVQLYRPMYMHTMDPNQAYELGTVAVKDFSRPVCMDSLGRRQKGLPYTDYRVAHTTTKLVEDENAVHREYKNLQELETERANVSYHMTPEDQMREKKEKKREVSREKAKVLAQQERDRRAFDQYDRIHRLMLGGAPQ